VFKLSKRNTRIVHSSLIALFVFILISSLFHFKVLQNLEWSVDDFKMQLLRKDSQANKNILVLLVDEDTLAAMDSIVGAWPWQRSVWADLLEYMAIAEAEAVAFDILFSERRGITKNRQLGEADIAFAELTAEAGMVTHAMVLTNNPHNLNANKPLPQIFDKFKVKEVLGTSPGNNNSYFLPYTPLYKASKQMGVVEFSPDVDGVYRRTNLFRDYQHQHFPVLSTALLMDHLNITKVVKSEAKRTIKIGDLVVPLDRDGNYQVKFYEKFNSISLASVFASISKMKSGDVESLYTNPNLTPPEIFTNKLIFVGTSAIGLEDLKTTPVEARWPGVYLHASITSNLLDKDFIYQIDKVWVYLMILVMSFIISSLVLAQDSIRLQLIFPALLVVFTVTTNIFVQYQWHLQADLVPPIFAMLASWLLISAYLSATEGREKKQVRDMMAQYVSPAALNSVLDNYEGVAKAGAGTEEIMSVVFSDIRSFTTISEGLQASEVVKMLNIHLEAMTQVTFDFGGTMDKFIGDATMAFWGAPLPDEKHHLHATQAAIEMYRVMDKVNNLLAEEGMKPIKIGVGVNSGKVILGNIGSSQKLDYTIIGDAVNLGARLEGLTKQYGVGILISEYTHQAISQQIPCALIDTVRVKGKQKPVKIYAPLGNVGDNDLAEKFTIAKQTEQAFKLYHQQEFKAAEQIFQSLDNADLLLFKELYKQRCSSYIKEPPEANWDGVFTLTSK